ncbi:MAG: hypothetical protein ACFFC6_10300 [Promethearchaeota archaeon]
MNVPIEKKMLFLSGMIFLGLFSTAYLVNSFNGNLSLPEAEIKFDDEGAKKAAEDSDLENGYQIPGFDEKDYEYKDATLTEEEVLAIAEALDVVQEFRADHKDVAVWAWYDGFDYWYVDYSVDYWDDYYIEENEASTGEIDYEAKPTTDYSYYPEWSYLTVIIQDSTGEVEKIIQPIEPNLTEKEVHDIAVNSDEGQAFLEEYPEAEIYIWFDSFQFWYVEFYPPYEYKMYDEVIYDETGVSDPEDPITEPGYIGYEWDYLSLVIDDLTREIIEVVQPVDPSLTEEEVIEIACNIPEIQALVEEYEDLEVWAYFDGYGLWYVEISSREHFEVWASVTIDDATAKIVDYFVPELPDMTKDEVIALALTDLDAQEFMNKYDDAIFDAYFYSSWFFDEAGVTSNEKEPEPGFGGETAAYWYVYFYSEIYVDAWGYLLISDETGDIFESEFYMPDLPTITYDQAISITQNQESTIEFINKFADDYGMYAYHYNGYYNVDVEVSSDGYEYSEGYEGEGGGIWYVVYYTPTEFDDWYIEKKGEVESKTYAELGFMIDSESGDILDTWYYDLEREIVPL